jgi:hypothetical protein
LKNFLLLTTLIVTVAATAQIMAAFYDYNWKPCPPENDYSAILIDQSLCD